VGTTIAVTVNGSSPVTVMSTTQNDAVVSEIYMVDEYASIGGTGTGAVRATIVTGGTGAAELVVGYVSAFQA
jgi:hypothetical protein